MKEQKLKTKMEKGITLIALIITIVVLLILAVVTIGSIRESKIIEHAETAKDTYKEKQIKEEVELFNAEYLLTTKRNMQDLTKERMIGICKKTGVKPEQLAVLYDLCNVNKNKNKENENTENYEKLPEEHLLYRIDKTTEEERTKLEEEGIKALYGDFDLDGYLTYNDVLLIEAYDGWVLGETGREATDLQIKIADMDLDGELSSNDAGCIEMFLLGLNNYWEVRYDIE